MIRLKVKNKKHKILLLHFWNLKKKNLYKKINKQKWNFLKNKLFEKFGKKWNFLKNKKIEYENNNFRRIKLNKSYKYLYKQRLIIKKTLKYIYGNISEKQFKFLWLNKLNTLNLIKKLECKLNIILFRSSLLTSLSQIKYLIKKKHIYLNGVKIRTSNIYLNPGDIIEIKNISLKKNILIKKPSYIEVNKSILKIILIKIPELKEIPFLIKLNFYLISELYRK